VDALRAIDGWGARTVAAGVATAGGVVATRGATATRMRLASVTKPLVALAVLIAVEEGVVGLDDPAGPTGSTVRHLLAHASGLAFDNDQVLAAPGTRRIYSNTGFDVLGRHLAERSGMTPAEYLQEAVLAPLGLARTELKGTPGAGAVGTLDDVLRFGVELLSPTLIDHQTAAQARQVQFPGLAGVLPGVGRFDPLDWGLGLELRDGKQPHWTGRRNSPATFGHFGGSGTFLWVDPEAGAVCCALTDREFGDWALEAWPAMSDVVLAELAGSSS
jgi:CubicO group peptidase (beta-lactamase class C family)